MSREEIQAYVSTVVCHAAKEYSYNMAMCNMKPDELYKHTLVDIQLLTDFIINEIESAKKGI